MVEQAELSVGKQESQEKKSIPIVKLYEPFTVIDFVETKDGAKSEFNVKLEGRESTKLAIILTKSTLPVRGSNDLEHAYALFGPVSAKIMTSSNRGNIVEISNVLTYAIKDIKGWNFSQSHLDVFIDGGSYDSCYPLLQGTSPIPEKMKDKTKYWIGTRWINGQEWAYYSYRGVSSRIVALPKPSDLQRLTFVFKADRIGRY